ncbi:hypothetical protein [Stenotrophomonas sp.]|uniref:hypothetical protein n=1 Tax=Stenotrophomonas sp. TaxID=69392 RepID=UPI002FCA8924
MMTPLAAWLLALAGALPGTPQLQDYPVALTRIDHYAPTRVPRHGIDWKLRQYLEGGGDGPLDFADRFTVYTLGCGSGCLQFALIDRRNGKVHPGLYLNNGRLAHRRDSRLLIATHNDGYGYPDILDYYLWDGRRLVLIKTEQRAFVPD